MAARKRVELLDQGSGQPFVQTYGEGRQMVPQLRQLERDAEAIRTVEARIRSTVQTLRAGGVSWAVIGYELGVTKQAAAARYGRDTL